MNESRMDYQRKYGWEQTKREEYIQTNIMTAQRQHQVFYQKKLDYFPLIRVPIQLPMYRLENGRTVSKQEEYLAIHPELGGDYFVRDKNSVEVQQAQHNLLLDLVKSTKLDEYFTEKDRQGNPVNLQREPLICTPEGFVVNGNRRLCCWRDLYYEHPDQYPHFKYLDAVILPVTDEDAILELEAELQIAPDIQEDYAWHAEALMMQRRRDVHQESLSSIAKKFRKKSAKEVECLINMRLLASEYLAWMGPDFNKRWSKVDGNQYAFRELVTQMSRINSPADKELFKEIAFALIRNSERDSDYRRIKDEKKYFDKVLRDLKAELLPIHQPVALPTEPEDAGDAFDLLRGGTASSSDELESTALLPIVGSINMAQRVAEIVEEAIDREKLFDKEKRRSTYIIDQARAANTMLSNALSVDLREPDLITDGLKEQLTAIEISVSKLREWLDERMSQD